MPTLSEHDPDTSANDDDHDPDMRLRAEWMRDGQHAEHEPLGGARIRRDYEAFWNAPSLPEPTAMERFWGAVAHLASTLVGDLLEIVRRLGVMLIHATYPADEALVIEMRSVHRHMMNTDGLAFGLGSLGS